MTKDRKILESAAESPNMRAFLWALRFGEGTQGENGFRTLFGGGLFEGFADHPRKLVTRVIKGKSYTSSAAGAWQFLSGTWDGLVREWGFEDFSPRMQALGAIALIRGRGALQDVLDGRIESAVAKCGREWASLPGSPYGQPVVTMDEFMREYREGLTQSTPAPATIPAPPTPPFTTLKERIVNPFVLAVLPSLIDLVPKLGKLFGSGSQVSERNIKAAKAVAQMAKDAIGARNEQELLDMVRTDPDAAAAVKAGIEQGWFKLEEVGGGVEAARASGERYAMPGGPDFRRNPAFWISLIFLLMPILIISDMLFLHPEAYDISLRTQVITAVLALLSIVGAFWLGTNFTTQSQKREAADTRQP